jgi:hypothetical protein
MNIEALPRTPSVLIAHFTEGEVAGRGLKAKRGIKDMKDPLAEKKEK